MKKLDISNKTIQQNYEIITNYDLIDKRREKSANLEIVSLKVQFKHHRRKIEINKEYSC